MAKVQWIESYQDGLAKARAENRLIFADFFNPN